jgi:hypothetical protein
MSLECSYYIESQGGGMGGLLAFPGTHQEGWGAVCPGVPYPRKNPESSFI